MSEPWDVCVAKNSRRNVSTNDTINLGCYMWENEYNWYAVSDITLWLHYRRCPDLLPNYTAVDVLVDVFGELLILNYR